MDRKRVLTFVILLLIIAMFVPFNLKIEYRHIALYDIQSILWYIQLPPESYSLLENPELWFERLQGEIGLWAFVRMIGFSFVRLILVGVVFLYYKGRTSREIVLMAGIITELQSNIIFSLFLFISPMHNIYPIILIPIPILTLLVLFVVLRYPRKEPEEPWLEGATT
ncbi:MAG: hypothetical protein P1Q69_13250 [Candidatus Thorarchaeota archaeon]|nr:hypothetical protein [Candidatus Thorarchaeota archaeon]